MPAEPNEELEQLELLAEAEDVCATDAAEKLIEALRAEREGRTAFKGTGGDGVARMARVLGGAESA